MTSTDRVQKDGATENRPPDNDAFLPDLTPAAAIDRARQGKARLRPVEALGGAIEAAAPAAARPGAKPRAKTTPPPVPEDTPAATPPPGRRPPRPKGEIWDGCPVKPLGVNGQFFYYLDALGQLRAVGKHERQTIMGLFAHRLPTLCHHFSKVYQDKETGTWSRKPNDFEADQAAMAMIAACGEQGLFDPDGAVRGVGAWCDDDGNLIYHTGDQLLTVDGPQEPMTHGGRIYPAYPPIPHPAPPGASDDAGATILDTLGTWQWTRDIDAMIGLGMIGVQMLGGALDWRPSFWVTGGKSSGKSTLQNLVRHLHGGEKGLIQSNDATKSGLTSRIGHSSLPVALDELEPGDEGSTKERDIIVLARVASSGGQWFRGSSDQKGTGGNVYSTFLFSSILIPGALKPQDLSRLVILTLGAFPDGTPAPVLRADTWRKRGAQLKHVLISRWSTWAQRLELWREAFAAEGLSGRNGDNWATVMAMADMALHAALPVQYTPAGDEMEAMAHRVARAVRFEVAEIGSDADGMLMHLLTQPLNVYNRGEQNTVAQWIMVAAQLPGMPGALMGSDTPADRADYAKAANAKLAKYGMRVSGTGQAAELFLANAPIQGLMDLFAKSEWARTVWKQSAARVTGAKASESSLKLAGVPTRGWLIPFAAMPGLLTFPMDKDASAPTHAVSPQPAEEYL